MHLQSHYKESWTKIRDGGYKLRLDAISLQSAKASTDILSDVSLQPNLHFLSYTTHHRCVSQNGLIPIVADGKKHFKPTDRALLFLSAAKV